MNPFSAINFSKLPAPDVVEQLDFEVILSEMLDDLRERLPEFNVELESDPAYKILEVVAYREFWLRAKINDDGRSVMLAYARGTNLDHLAALYGIERQEIEPGDNSVIPARPPLLEKDDRFRLRMQLSLEGHTTAGPTGSYIYHAFASDSRVKDVSVISPSPGEVLVTILSTENDGLPSDELLKNVNDFLSAGDIRPLTDKVTVQVPTIQSYAVIADLFLFDGPDRDIIMQASVKSLKRYIEDRQRLGQDVVRSGLFSALHTEGVQRVHLIEPSQNIVIPPSSVASVESISVNLRGFDE